MKITLSVIKADVGSIAGHLKPSSSLLEAVRGCIAKELGGLIIDYNISHTGDDVAILLSHQGGVGNERVHKLAWDAFICGTEKAKEQGLYGAGQDLLVDLFRQCQGMGPAVAELEFEERENEPLCYLPPTKPIPGLTTFLYIWVLPIPCTVRV